MILQTVLGQPYSSNEYENLPEGEKEDEYRVMATPRFLSTPQTLLVNEGDTIRLPCKVDRLEGFVMLWKKDKNIITVGDQIVDKSVRLEKTKNGNSIAIGPATIEDEADYTCQISSYKPTFLLKKCAAKKELRWSKDLQAGGGCDGWCGADALPVITVTFSTSPIMCIVCHILVDTRIVPLIEYTPC